MHTHTCLTHTHTQTHTTRTHTHKHTQHEHTHTHCALCDSFPHKLSVFRGVLFLLFPSVLIYVFPSPPPSLYIISSLSLSQPLSAYSPLSHVPCFQNMVELLKGTHLHTHRYPLHQYGPLGHTHLLCFRHAHTGI